MEKFKVGDVVRPNKKADSLYRMTNRAHMKEGVVIEVSPHGALKVRITKWVKNADSIDTYWVLNPACFDLVRRGGVQTELHITGDGKTVHAVLKENGKVVKRAKASCDPRDEYNFETGARLATDRVFGKEAEKKEPTYKFNIGDPVVVTDKNEAFPYFKDFVKQYDEDTQLLFAYGHCPKKGDNYTVIKRGLHPETKAPLYLIQPSSNTLSSGELYLIGERGLASLYDCCKYL